MPPFQGVVGTYRPIGSSATWHADLAPTAEAKGGRRPTAAPKDGWPIVANPPPLQKVVGPTALWNGGKTPPT
jgi:hypothetical protein